jgi:GNAT superfamily N-acetyltransferase
MQQKSEPLVCRIHLLQEEECEAISQAFTDQGWNKPTVQYLRYLEESKDGRRVVLVADIDGKFAGYVTVVWESDYPPFCEAGIPEIVDLNVLKKYQRRGIASRLLDAAEQEIAVRSPIAGIGVGLLPDYGPAQVLYVRRGYVPDGRGCISHGRYLSYGEMFPADDDVALCLTRRLDQSPKR